MIDLGQAKDYTGFFLAGMIGGFIRALVVGKGVIVFGRPWEDKRSGKKGWDLGIFSSLLIGGIVGLIVDQSPLTALSFGISGSYVIEELIKKDTTK